MHSIIHSMKSFLRITVLLGLLSLSIPLVSHALLPVPESRYKTVDQVLGAGGPLTFIMQILFTVLIIFSVFMVLYASYLYLTSQGNEEKVAQATKSIFWAAVGIAVAVLARSLPPIIGDLLNQPGIESPALRSTPTAIVFLPTEKVDASLNLL